MAKGKIFHKLVTWDSKGILSVFDWSAEMKRIQRKSLPLLPSCISPGGVPGSTGRVTFNTFRFNIYWQILAVLLVCIYINGFFVVIDLGIFHFLQFCSLNFICYHALSRSGQAVINFGPLDLHFEKYFFCIWNIYCIFIEFIQPSSALHSLFG